MGDNEHKLPIKIAKFSNTWKTNDKIEVLGFVILQKRANYKISSYDIIISW